MLASDSSADNRIPTLSCKLLDKVDLKNICLLTIRQLNKKWDNPSSDWANHWDTEDPVWMLDTRHQSIILSWDLTYLANPSYKVSWTKYTECEQFYVLSYIFMRWYRARLVNLCQMQSVMRLIYFIWAHNIPAWYYNNLKLAAVSKAWKQSVTWTVSYQGCVNGPRSQTVLMP